MAMPRKEPPPGFLHAKEAADMLQVTDAMLSKYVKQGRLNRYGPEERRHKFYKLSEVQAIIDADKAFFEAGDKPSKHLTSFFSLATTDDMPFIVDIDKRTFHEDLTEETYLRWMRKNPETFFVLRDETNKVIGFACLLPMKKETMDRLVRDEIGMDDISPDDVDLYEPGKPLHLYLIALCVDPAFKRVVKRTYGASLIRGLFAFFLSLAERGVEIETLTARSFKTDGIRLMRDMGIPQLRSPVAGKHLFSVHVAESGFYIFVDYSDLLAKWKREHQQGDKA
jgi:ribosomal protein S18 acetylase RimI-like enzyme